MKGVSPLIAGVLLVVITVGVSIIVLPFVTQYAQQTSEEASEASLAVTDCALEQLSIKSVWIDTYRNRVRALTVAGGQSDIVIKSSAGLDSSGVSCVSNASQVIGKGSQQVIELDCAVYEYDCSDFDRLLVTSSCGKTYTYTLAPSTCTGPTVVFSGNATGIEVNLTNETANSLVFNIEVEGEGSGYADVTIDVDDASKMVFKNDSGTIVELSECGTEPCILSRDLTENIITLRIPIGDPQFFVTDQQLTHLNDWWNSSWDYRTPVTVTNENDTKTLAEGYTVSTSFDLAGCVSAGNCMANSDDVRLVYYNGSEAAEIDRVLEPSTALSFDYDPVDWVGDYVEANLSQDIGSSYTMAAWFYANSLPFSEWQGIVTNGIDSGSHGIWIYENKIDLYVNGKHLSYNNISTNTWYHVAIAYNGSHGWLYINGELDPNFPVTLPQTSIPSVKIASSGWEEYFDGIIDEVSIFNRSLSSEEVSQLYNNGTALPLELTGVSSTGLVGLWHFDEGYGDIARDVSGNDNDGAIIGASWTNSHIVPEAVSADAAVSFDGVDDIIIVQNPQYLDFGVNDFTISAWANLLECDGNYDALVGKMDGEWFGFALLDACATSSVPSAGFWVSDPDFDTVWIGGTSPAGFGWNHFVGVRRNDTFELWINGVLDDNLTNPNVGNLNNIGNLSIGNFEDKWGSWPTKSIVDEVAIWNRSLSEEEIAAIYNSGRPLEPDNSTVLLMHFDDRESITKDSSSSGNHGTLKNGAYFTGGHFTSQKNNTLWFKTQADVVSTDDNYSLYYGNPDASQPAVDLNNVFPYSGSAAGAWHFEPGSDALIAEDSSGNNNTGSLGNGNATKAPKFVDGKFGWGLDLDGVNDFVDAGNDSSLNFGTGDFSIETWVKIQGLSYGGGIVVKYYGTPSRGFVLFTDTGIGYYLFTISLYDNLGNTIDFNSQYVNFDEWYHVVVVRSGDTVEMYINGVFDSNQTVLGFGNIDTTTPLEIGRWYYNGAEYFPGLIDEVAIYNRALTPAEISAMYIYPDPTTALASAQPFPVI